MDNAYEDMRIELKGDLALKLVHGSLKDVLYSVSSSCNILDHVLDNHMSSRSRCMFDDAELNKFIEIFNSDGSGEEEVPKICQPSSLLASNESENSSQNVGDNIIQKNGCLTQTEIYSDKAKVMDALYSYIGTSQVTRRQRETAQSWLVISAIEEKLTKSWTGEYTLVRESITSLDANIIGSQFVFKIEVDESSKRLKARLCPHGNQDKQKGKIREDSAYAGFVVTHLLLTLASAMNFRLGSAGVQEAYLQSEPINRDLNVRPPPEIGCEHGMI